MAKPNYAFAKRQRDLAKKQKKEEKKLRKAGSATESGDTVVDAPDDTAGVLGTGGVLGDGLAQPRGPANLAAEQAAPLGGEPPGLDRQQPGRA